MCTNLLFVSARHCWERCREQRHGLLRHAYGSYEVRNFTVLSRIILTQYQRSRIPKLNEYCVICDENHLFGSNMLKPAVCTRDLCCWSFQQLKVGSEAAEDIATDAEVVDLLVSMTINAVKSNRNNVIFSPFPTGTTQLELERKIVAKYLSRSIRSRSSRSTCFVWGA